MSAIICNECWNTTGVACTHNSKQKSSTDKAFHLPLDASLTGGNVTVKPREWWLERPYTDFGHDFDIPAILKEERRKTLEEVEKVISEQEEYWNGYLPKHYSCGGHCCQLWKVRKDTFQTLRSQLSKSL